MDPPASDIATTEQPPAPDISLRDANPQWLYRIFLGVSGMAIGQVITLFMFALLMFFFLARHINAIEDDTMLRWFPKPDPMGYAIFWFSAIFLLAVPQHAEDNDPQVSRFRRPLIYIGCAY